MFKQPAPDIFRTIQSRLYHLGHFIFFVFTCTFRLRMVIFPLTPFLVSTKETPIAFLHQLTRASKPKVFTPKCSVTHLILYLNPFSQYRPKKKKLYPEPIVRCLCNKLMLKSDRKFELRAALVLLNLY